MALLFTDSCDHNIGSGIGTAPHKWRNQGATDDIYYKSGDGRFGTGGLWLTGHGAFASQTIYSYYFPTTDPTCVLGMAIRFDAARGEYGDFYFLQNDSTAGYIYHDSVNRYSFYWNGILYQTDFYYTYGQYNYYEHKIYIHDSSGYIIIRANEDIILNVTGIDTKTGSIDYINQLGGHFNSPGMHVDDIYFLNTQGSVNNDFLGDVRVEFRQPDGNGSYTQFTGSDGDSLNNYQLVDENVRDEDTTYIITDGIGSIDTYTLQDMTTVAGDVKGVNYMLRARKDDSGNRRIAPITYINGGLYQKDTINLPSSYTTYWQIQETNPATSNTWTLPEINNLEFGVKLVE